MRSADATGHALVHFPPFVLDPRAGQLRRDGEPVPLRPKNFAVLEYLARRPGELVTKGELLDAVWGDVVVTEDVVRLSVSELRTALGDDRVALRFIETVPRRGYRFVAKLGFAGGTPPRTADEGANAVVGRVHERAEIAAWIAAAATGHPQIAFVAGEAGIGKTTLVDAALHDARHAAGAALRVTHGQCIEHYGTGEPYMPVLDAIARLCRAPDGPEVAALLRGHAPAWLLQVMGLQPPSAEAHPGSAPTTREHTLRILATALTALAAETPLLLVLEDIHWSDFATIDLLNVLAQREEPARLLVLCTLRPADAIARGHPVTRVVRELRRKGLCREIQLAGLGTADVASYLALRFAGAPLPAELLPLLVGRSEGNPFFMVALVDHLLERGLLVRGAEGWRSQEPIATLRTAIPEGLRAVIEPRLERLTPDELRLLEAASVAGVEFAADVVAASASGVGELGDVEAIEQRCDGLVRRQEILQVEADPTRPDVGTSTRYRFRHALYPQVLYQRLAPATRRRLHQSIGEALEANWAGKAVEIASELAVHFERGGDLARAVRYHREAAAHAKSRFADQETRLHLEAALELTCRQPETSVRLEEEMLLLYDLGTILFAIHGWGDEGAARIFLRVRDLAERLDVAPMRLIAMGGLAYYHAMRGELATARQLGTDMLALAEQIGNPLLACGSHTALGSIFYNLGQLERALEHFERGGLLFDRDAPQLHTDLGVLNRSQMAFACAHRGMVGRARALSLEAIARGEDVGTPFNRAYAGSLAAQLAALIGDVREARARAEDAHRLATDYGFPLFRATTTMVGGWCSVAEGRVADGRAALLQGFEAYTATGQGLGRTFFLCLVASAHLAHGDVISAQAAVSTALALAVETGELLYEHELHRLRGECLLARDPTRRDRADAKAHFERALALATERQALLFALRAATSLGRIGRGSTQARLAELVALMCDGDGADIRAAQAVLATAGPRSSARG